MTIRVVSTICLLLLLSLIDNLFIGDCSCPPMMVTRKSFLSRKVASFSSPLVSKTYCLSCLVICCYFLKLKLLLYSLLLN